MSYTHRVKESLIRKIIVISLIVILGFAWVITKRRPKALPALQLTAAQANKTGRNSCAGKPNCIFVYLAPWCPACRGSLEGVRSLIDYSETSIQFGFNVIIGGDSRDKLEAMAHEIGDHTFVDVNDSFANAAAVEGIPQWVIVDGNGNILKEAHGALGPGASVKDYLSFLGLER